MSKAGAGQEQGRSRAEQSKAEGARIVQERSLKEAGQEYGRGRAKAEAEAGAG